MAQYINTNNPEIKLSTINTKVKGPLGKSYYRDINVIDYNDFLKSGGDAYGAGRVAYTGGDGQTQYLDIDTANRLRARDVEYAQDQNYQKKLRDQVAADRKAAMAEGEQYANKYYNDAEMKKGFVDANQTQDQLDILARRKSALNGMNAEENQAAREEAFKGVQSDQAAANRTLQGKLGASNIRGGAALAAQLEMAKQNAATSVDLNRKLTLDNVNLKNAALGAYEQTYNSQRDDLLKRQGINIAREDTFRNLRAGTPLLYAGLSAGERGEAMSQLLGQKGIEAAREYQGGGGKKHICGELRRRGLMTKDEYDRMSRLSARSIFRYGDFSKWYFKNAKKIIHNMNHMNVDWLEVKSMLITPAMDLLEAGYEDAAAHHYGKILKYLSQRFGHQIEGVEKFEDHFFTPGIGKNIKGIAYTVLHPDFWATTLRLVKKDVRKFLRAKKRQLRLAKGAA